MTGGADDRSLAELIGACDAETLADVAEKLTAEYGAAVVGALARSWLMEARPSQLPPPEPWRLWVIMAGRGFGKTRAGAEWIDAMARRRAGIRVALIGATHDDVRQVMIEGESGLLSLSGHQHRPAYHPALRRLIWPGGSIATCYSAAEPEGLRGPQQHIAWADEVARWGAGGGQGGLAAWHNLMMGMRLGERPQVLATTTPRAVPIMKMLLALPGAIITGGSSHANAANLPGDFLDRMQALYGDSLLGRQEILGELLSDTPGALWTRAMIDRGRRERMQPDDAALMRVVVGVDPPASRTGDSCGIIVAARLCDGTMAILDDASVDRASPERWAMAVAGAARLWSADAIIAEANNGGDMVRSVLCHVDADMPVTLVHARRGKSVRAEPVAFHYAQGRIAHHGVFAKLEDQLCGMTAHAGYAGPGRSPDRADALVWAVHALIGSHRAAPQIREL